MTQKTIKIFIDEFFSKPPEKTYSRNKTDVYYNDNIWSLDIIDLKSYVPGNDRGYRYILVVIDIFSKIRWPVPLKECSNNKRLLWK